MAHFLNFLKLHSGKSTPTLKNHFYFAFDLYLLIILVCFDTYFVSNTELKKAICNCIELWIKNYHIVSLDSMNKKAITNCEFVLLNFMFMISEKNFQYDCISKIIHTLLSASSNNFDDFLKFIIRTFTLQFGDFSSINPVIFLY